MSKICPNCKKRYADFAVNCADCGIALCIEGEAQPQYEPQPAPQPQYEPQPAPQPQYEPQPAPQPQYEPQPRYEHQPQYQQHISTPTYQPAPTIEANKEKLYPAVSTATYFWLNIAMRIPFVGLILSIVLTCAPRNRSLKNYSRAHLIANLILIGSVITLIILSAAVGENLLEMIFYDSYFSLFG